MNKKCLIVTAALCLALAGCSSDSSSDAASSSKNSSSSSSSVSSSSAGDNTSSSADDSNSSEADASSKAEDDNVDHTKIKTSKEIQDGDTNYTAEHDNKGNMIKQVFSNNNYTLYEYDSKDRVISEVTYSSDGTELNRVTTEYDDHDNVIKEEKDGTVSKYLYTYDNKDQLIKYIDYDSDGSEYRWEEYKYDDKGNNIEHTFCDKGIVLDNKIKERHKNEFDSKGNMIKTTEYSGRDELLCTIEYVYDSNNNKIKEISKSKSGKTGSIRTYDYDSNGNMIKESWTENDEPCAYIYEFDAKGNRTMSCRTRNNKPEKKSTYEYDDFKNITHITNYDYYDDKESVDTDVKWEYTYW